MEHQLYPGSSEPYYTLPQAGKHLNIPVSTLRRAASSGLIPTHKPFGERIRVRLSEIEAATGALAGHGSGASTMRASFSSTSNWVSARFSSVPLNRLASMPNLVPMASSIRSSNSLKLGSSLLSGVGISPR
ncbi:MAG: hypothetical protein COA43_04640 [Robiginitomaculum sp.]|nr:MAG: hypothetical protein COA43_04640 [Robiginitomaculum sp.]